MPPKIAIRFLDGKRNAGDSRITTAGSAHTALDLRRLGEIFA